MKFKTKEETEVTETQEVKDTFFIELYGKLQTISFLYSDDEEVQEPLRQAKKVVKRILDTWYEGWEMPSISITPEMDGKTYVKDTFAFVEENCPFDLKKLMAAYSMAILMPKLLKNG